MNVRVTCERDVLCSQICDSYPEQLIVPKAIGDELILKSSLFRHHKRFPVVCYYHHRKKVSGAQLFTLFNAH